MCNKQVCSGGAKANGAEHGSPKLRSLLNKEDKDMLVLSCDRKSVIDAKVLQVTRNLGGGKDGKYVISALVIGGIRTAVVAQFPDEKTAIDALEKAYTAFAEGAKAYKFE